MRSRLERVRAQLQEWNLTALLVTQWENIYYLSGFSGSDGALVVGQDGAWLISDFRYALQAAEEAPAWEFVQSNHALFADLHTFLAQLGPGEIGFEADHLTIAQHQQLLGETNDQAIALRSTQGIVAQLRLVKDQQELAYIREAVRITDGAYAHLCTLIKPGVTEKELALEAEWYMRRQGADGLAFDIIIATGARGALPHAQPGESLLTAGDLVVVDMGARYARYCADMTRTFAVGHATAQAKEIYQVCLDAQLAGLAGITAGMTGAEADAVVRQVIAQHGYGEYFGHGTGHGVGLEIHEAPRAGRTAEQRIPVGATLTVEPGIYLPHIGGVRIEDLTVVTETGLDVLTASPKPMALPVLG